MGLISIDFAQLKQKLVGKISSHGGTITELSNILAPFLRNFEQIKSLESLNISCAIIFTFMGQLYIIVKAYPEKIMMKIYWKAMSI